ncbi:Dam family site-specific DNA-(adenine-N6)-methyltransferase [Caballeronia sp. LjRoot34]|uniref:DNA adenine methylase n=1 Tax=Caballeronia sp. LjRoot34 TaxID=3342325 RepID=UPI003ECD3200
MNKNPVAPARPIRPFLRWVGGKSRVLQHIVFRLPRGKRLVEPFVGGGSIFLNTHYESYLLADSNRHLVELYQAVANGRDGFVEMAKAYFEECFRTPERYLSVRAAFNAEQDALARAAQFLYLNRFNFNGLCRYNKAGGFNVPYGYPTRPPRFPFEEITAFSAKAEHADFIAADFAKVMCTATSGDVVYCDPPYLDPDSAKTFTGYSPSGFSMERQLELASISRELARKGVPVAISNHDCQTAREIYAGAEIFTFDARRSVSAASEKRGAARELLAIFR